MADPFTLLATAALSALNMGLTASRTIEGPRLTDLKFTGGDYGNPIPFVFGKRRMQVPIFWAEDLKEVKQTRKTKGGKYNDYTYYGTWAVALADNLIEAVSRMWFDDHLVFDMTGAGPVTPFDFSTPGGGKGGGPPAHGGIALNDHMSIYLGTEDQDPDPRVLATTEAKNGEGTCPAYRGVAYAVFKDIPLEKVGNRIPQVAVEIVTASTGSIPSENFTPTYLPNVAFGLQFSPDYATVGWVSSNIAGSPGLEIWDVAARASMLTIPVPVGTWTDGLIGVYNDGSVLYVEFEGDLKLVNPSTGTIETVLAGAGASEVGCSVVQDGNGIEHWGTYPFSFGGTWYFDGVSYAPGYQACQYFVDTYGNVWVAGRVASGTQTTAYFKRLVTVDNSPGYLEEFSVTGLASAAGSSDGDKCHACATGDDFLLRWGNGGDTNYLIDPTTGTVTATVSASDQGNVNSEKVPWVNLAPGSNTIWLGNSEYTLATGTLVRTVTGAPAGSGQYVSVYDPVNHALWTGQSGITIYYLDRVGSSGVTLNSISTTIAAKAGIVSSDFSNLDQTISGWSVTQGQGSNMLEPLFDAYDCDIRPHDFTLQGIKRTGTSGGTILTERFVGDPRYTVKIRQAAELPRAVTITFADIDHDQQPNNVRSDRPLDATNAKGEQTLDLQTLALGTDTARQLGDRYFRRLWNSRREVSTGLTAQQLALEPGDIRTLNLDGQADSYRLTRLTVQASDVLQTEWTYDSPTLALTTSAAGATFDGRDESKIIIGLISKGFVLDIPLLTDADSSSNPLLYVAAAPFVSGTWPGATIFERIDGDYTDELANVDTASQAAWGYATDTLPDANPNLWDRGSSVNVKLQTGSLSGRSEAAIDSDPGLNQALIGDEIVNFTVATLEIDGTYTLSGFKRGRRGTEWACATHGTRDVFLLLSTASDETMGLSDVGTALSFKAVTAGRTESGAYPIDVAFTGASLKPYAPCLLNASQNASTGTWTLGWTRRTRVGGDWTSGTSIPLSEASEEYEVEILDIDTGLVKRTYTGLTSPSATYSAADQATDYGITISGFSWRVYQISAAVGRGFAAEGTAAGGTDGIGAVTSTQWRLDFPQGAVSWPEPNVAKVQMRGRFGGADQCSGGVADASTEFSGSFHASNAFDNSNATIWASTAPDATTSWLRYTFASAVHVGQITVTATGDPAPKQIVLKYWDGAAWQTAFTSGTLTTWGSTETKTFNV